MGNKVLFLFFVVVLATAISERGVLGVDEDEGDNFDIIDTDDSADDKVVDIDTKSKTKSMPGGPKVLASVREFPLFLHKCMATFINPFTLVATGSCLVCIGNCKMYIRVLGNTLENPKDPVYEVQSTVKHPLYEKNPSEYNIGIIYLKKNVPDAPVYDLPYYGIDLTHLPGIVYAWHFTDKMTTFRLIRYKAHTISNELCSNYANEFVSNTYVCVVAEKLLQLGPFDHGTPMIAQAGKKGIIMGMFIKPGVVENGEVVEFTSILPFLEWIKNNIRPNPNPAPVPTSTTTQKPTTHPNSTTKKPTTKPTTTTKKQAPKSTTHPTTTTKQQAPKSTTHPTTTTKQQAPKSTTHPTTTTKQQAPKSTTTPKAKPLTLDPNEDGDSDAIDQSRGHMSGLSFPGHIGGVTE